MTLNKIKDYWHLLEAIRSGKILQWTNDRGSTWNDYSPDGYCSFSAPPEEYRVKPEKKWRAWEAEEVPVGCLLRHRVIEFGLPTHTVLLARRGAWCHFIDPTTGKLTDTLCHKMNNLFEHSTDGGRTWLPCGIETAE